MGKVRPANVPKVVNGQYTYSIRAFNPSGASRTMAITFIQVPYDNAWFRERQLGQAARAARHRGWG